MSDDRPCTCHPDEAPVPCQKRYAFSECELSALRAELAAADHYTDRIAQLTEEMKERHDEFAAYRIDVNRRISKLREALEPFAYYAAKIPDDVSDMASASGTVGDLRHARAVLAETKGDANEQEAN